MPGRCRTGAARPSASTPTRKFSADAEFRPATLYRMARSKAYLFRGVEIRWSCDPSLPRPDGVPQEARLHFPGGLGDFLSASLADKPLLTPRPFLGKVDFPDGGSVEWAVAWPEDEDDGLCHSYCNTIPTIEGGTHEAGLRNALTRGLKALWRADRQQAHRPGDRRGRHHRRGDAVVVVSARSAIPGADQGAARVGRGNAPRRERGARPFRPLARRRPGNDPASARSHRRARRGAHPPAPAEGDGAQDRDTQAAAARQALRLHPRQRYGHRNLPRRRRQRRRLGQAGAQPRNAGDPAVARQDPQRRQRLGRQDARQPGAQRHHPRARLPAPAATTRKRRCATSGSSS